MVLTGTLYVADEQGRTERGARFLRLNAEPMELWPALESSGVDLAGARILTDKGRGSPAITRIVREAPTPVLLAAFASCAVERPIVEERLRAWCGPETQVLEPVSAPLAT